MIKELFTSEAHVRWYVWGAVGLAHLAIGIMLGELLGSVIIVAIGYAAFEAVQIHVGQKRLLWDSLLDWVLVVLGACASVAIANPLVVYVCALAVVLVGVLVRHRRSEALN